MTLADSSVWIDFFAGRSNPESLWLRKELLNQRIGLTDLILCEILQGVRDDAEFRRTHLLVSRLPIFECGGEHLAVASAQNYRALRVQGITIRKTIDCLIATFCIEEGHSLLHRDRDFDPFEIHLALKVIHA